MAGDAFRRTPPPVPEEIVPLSIACFHAHGLGAHCNPSCRHDPNCDGVHPTPETV